MQNSESRLSPRLHPETGLYHVDFMPPAPDVNLREVRAKQLGGQPLTISESMLAGRDDVVTRIGDYELKPDHAYRAIGHDALDVYVLDGYVRAADIEEQNEFEEGKNNQGLDWYLGGVAFKYGSVVLEAPADPTHFEPAAQNGFALAKNPKVLHMKSSGSWRPLPMSKVRVIHDGNSKDGAS